jgi:hypothetical protein
MLCPYVLDVVQIHENCCNEISFISEFMLEGGDVKKAIATLLESQQQANICDRLRRALWPSRSDFVETARNLP